MTERAASTPTPPRADAPIERVRFATRDAEEGAAYVRQTYVGSRLRVREPTGAVVFSSDLLAFGGVFVARTANSVATTVEAAAGVERLVIFDTRRPMVIGPGHEQLPLGVGDSMCVATGVPYRLDWDSMDADAVSFAPGLLDDVATVQLGTAETLRFDFAGAVSAVALESWRRTCRLVRGVAAASAGRRDSSLLADELARLLAAAALTSFRNTSMADHRVGPTRTTPASLRRAVAFVDGHLDRPLRLTTIAEAARVSPRALNQTFNRHLGTSPMGYVHRARLDHAHRDLLDAEPGDGQTVTAIAARWGFYDLARFGVIYRKAYGRPPSRALRQDPAGARRGPVPSLGRA